MTLRTEDFGMLQRHICDLRYAVATTSCEVTAHILQRKLNEAEARLRGAAERLNASSPDLL